MNNIKFIYFNGCPNAQRVMDILSQLDLEFEKIEQTALGDDNEFKHYSSPSVIADGEIIFGSKTKGGGCSLNIPTVESLKQKLKL